jgi:hypothetical protein
MKNKQRIQFRPMTILFWTVTLPLLLLSAGLPPAGAASLEDDFQNPPPANRPWVYWYFMDGNITREGLTADLEAMHAAGIGGAVFLEVDLGLPRGPVKFMSAEWRKLFTHAVHEAERLGIEIVLASGPGWCGTGGPWVKPEQSMQHLVASETNVVGPLKFDGVLARPQPRAPFFGEATLTPEFARDWREFYRDVAVLAFPKPKGDRRLPDVDEKAIYQRAPYSSFPGVKSSLPMPAEFPAWPVDDCIAPAGVVELTAKMSSDGRLQWDVPAGEWTILRFVRTATGQITRPAPVPGLGFETDKFDPAAVDAHLEQFVGKLLKEVGPRKKGQGGLSTLHFDSWEMSAQNWSEKFRAEFQQRRGYDPLRFLPAFTGRVVDSVEITERFLWDVRKTAQELTIANHLSRLRDFAHRNGLSFSLEPYDMNPNGDLSMGAIADVPMGEFWWHGYNTTYSVIEAASIAHTCGRSIVGAESFTSEAGEDWRAHPANMKTLGDWAFAAGINRIAFHRYQHQPWLDRWPGMRMGPYGVHWERTQTWWPMVSAYHAYLARCSMMLRQGQTVADILFLAAEGAPHVFRPPASATVGNPPDRRGYNFDGCAPETLLANAKVSQGRIVFPGGTSYRMLVLPEMETMTPTLLRKVKELVHAGATVVGAPPKKSPSLSGFPSADAEVQKLAAELWGNAGGAGKGRILWGAEFAQGTSASAATPSPLEGAKWIWFDEGDPAVNAPVPTRYFRRTLELPADAVIESATIDLTADNGFILSVNGQEVGKAANFTRISKFDLKTSLRRGVNEVAVIVDNGGDGPNPAGLIASVEVLLRNGRLLRWQTDRAWTASMERGAVGRPARELGPLGMAPWGQPTPLSGEQKITTGYPEYDALARVLQAAGVPPDFEADGPIRYTHRTDDGTEIYFVANRAEQPLEANCVFRVTGRQPELWHPVTGERRALSSFAVKDGRTTLALRFEPLESYFIVFRKSAGMPKKTAFNFADAQPVQEIAGPWQVSFSAKWGAPEQVTFATLEDWTKRPETGIKFYSGLATYQKAFDATDLKLKNKNSKLFLDLGMVKNMARVKLNGRDLGVVWCAPWRVEVTDALKSGANELEITVANLWINRLIGDAALPTEQRLTWTSVNPYTKDSPLVSSGLLGPVMLQREMSTVAGARRR